MEKVVVVGVSGNGKTTLSRELARYLGVEHTELDRLNHLPGWVEADDETFRAQVETIINGSEGWVLDGSYIRKLGDLVLKRADTLVWLDQPLLLVLWRLIKRAVGQILSQRELFNGNRQTWRMAFVGRDSLVGYAIRMHFRRRREWPSFFAAYENLRIIRLRSPRDVERWLDDVRTLHFLG